MKTPILENTRVLVTGGAGFIGSNLVEMLLNQNNEVTVLDNFSTGKMENLLPFSGNRNFKLIVGDIRDMDKCHEAAAGQDYILHEAALGSVPRSIKDPMTTTAVNILGFVNMLYAAQEAGVKRFVYAASSSTYGDSWAERLTTVRTPMLMSDFIFEKKGDGLSRNTVRRVIYEPDYSVTLIR